MESSFSIQNYLTERNGKSKVSILTHPAFWIGLGVKIAASFFLASSVLTQNYIPFVNYFISSHFSNPYEWASLHGVSFPFPALMLFILTVPQLLFGFFPHASLFIPRIPVLVADLAIFLVLTRWLKDKQEKVLWYYWCSPILFAISYIGGFLDIIPIAFLFAFLYFLFKDKYLFAFILLGLALATKTGLVVLLPFIFIYLLREYEHPIKALEYILLSCSIYLLSSIGYLSSPGFWHTALSGGESFVSNINIDFGGVIVYILPLVYIGLLASSLVFQRLNRDLFLMFLAFALGSITIVVLPQAGWYCWIIPFFIYFFVKEDRVKKYPFVLLNLSYFVYFLVAPGSVFLETIKVIPPIGFTHVAINLAFTVLQGVLLLNIVWIYRLGIQNSIKYKILYKPYLVGVAGDSASGKSTLTRLISNTFGEHNTLEVAGDDMHKWERGDPNWSHITHLNPLANKLHDDMQQTLRLKKNENVVRNFYDHTIGRFTAGEQVRPKKIIVFQGLHTLYLHRNRELLDLKIFLSPNEELRRRWKVDRDVQERGSAPEKVLQQLAERDADSQKYIQEQRKHADIVISLTEVGGRQILEVYCDNSINADPFVNLLKNKTDIQIFHEHAEEAQHLVIEGDVSSESVDILAYELVPEISEINHREQLWEGGLNGAIQLFLAYTVFYKAKLEHDTF